MRKSFRKRRINIPIYAVVIVFFILSLIFFNVQINQETVRKTNESQDANFSQFPIIYQEINGFKTNVLRAYRNQNYSMVSNESLSVLGKDRDFTMVIKKNNTEFENIEYEIRDKNSNELIERTVVGVPFSKDNEVKVSTNLQNLIEKDRIYMMSIKIDLIDKRAFYFTNIIYKDRTNLESVIEMVSDFTKRTFSKTEAATLVKYLETSKNKDLRQLHHVTIQSSYDQITWADTKMKLESDLHLKIYEAQNYCFNIDIDYLTSEIRDRKKQLFINTDKYVVRWDDKRYYIMKFDRTTEELINVENREYDIERDRLYLGITNINDVKKIESAEKNYFMFAKRKEIYIYDREKRTLKNIYSNGIRDKESYEKVFDNYDVKLISIEETGEAKFIVYGYNMRGTGEGYIGISFFTYLPDTDTVEENFFIPLYTTYQSLKYDLNKLCTYINNQLYFKTYDRVYSIDVNTEELVLKTQNIDETTSAASTNGKFLAYNSTDVEKKDIIIVNLDENKQRTISPKSDETIEVITCMNDDLFYGVTKTKNIWNDSERVVGRVFDSIQVVNLETDEKKIFSEKNIYYYNFIASREVLKYNKYEKEGEHFNLITNGVIINNYQEEKIEEYQIKEEFLKEKLRVAYISLGLKNEQIIYKRYTPLKLKMIEVVPIEKEVRKEKDIYYVYDNGNLVSKKTILADGISEIRDSFGYVKLNDKTTCYNRSNKANVSYLRQNDSILENIKEFRENFYLKENSVLVMNITGVTERDLEYYISLGEKVAVYRDNEFKYFVTGYDNMNYVLEYPTKDRILTPRSEVKTMIVDRGYVLYAQLEKLE